MPLSELLIDLRPEVLTEQYQNILCTVFLFRLQQLAYEYSKDDNLGSIKLKQSKVSIFKIFDLLA
jgi:hypothetical protein